MSNDYSIQDSKMSPLGELHWASLKPQGKYKNYQATVILSKEDGETFRKDLEKMNQLCFDNCPKPEGSLKTKNIDKIISDTVWSKISDSEWGDVKLPDGKVAITLQRKSPLNFVDSTMKNKITVPVGQGSIVRMETMCRITNDSGHGTGAMFSLARIQVKDLVELGGAGDDNYVIADGYVASDDFTSDDAVSDDIVEDEIPF